MPNFSTSHIGCWDSLYFISGLFKYGYQPNISCNKSCDIGKIKRMVINLIPLVYVNNYDKNRYLEFFSKAAISATFKVLTPKTAASFLHAFL